MLRFFEQRFGPYPFATYGTVVIDSDIDAFNAMEHQTFSLYARSRLTRQDTMAHELAHEWFGNSVSLSNWQDTWLKEGPATYAEWLWETQLYSDQFLPKRLAKVYAETTWDFPPVRFPPQDKLLNNGVYLRVG